MKDLRLEIKIKNNLLYKKIMERYKSINDFAFSNNLHPSSVGTLLNFKRSPIMKNKKRLGNVDGTGGMYRWISTAIKLSNCLSCLPEDIFPDHLIEARKNYYELEIESAKLVRNTEPKLLDDYIFEKDKKEVLLKVLSTLTPRERKILRMRFGLDGDGEKILPEIAKSFDITTVRVRQIEANAFRKLRHPSRSKKLRCFIES